MKNIYFFCRHYNKQINYQKGKRYCHDKINCWALKIFFKFSDLKKYENKFKKKKRRKKNDTTSSL